LNNILKNNLLESANIIEQFVSEQSNIDAFNEAGKFLSEAFTNGKRAFSCGNGGSMCDAMHFAEELTGRFRDERKALPAVAIADSSHISCVSNDYGYDSIFSRYLEAWAQEGDVLLAISTSGNSVNVLKAAEFALKKGMKVIALTGKSGGKLANVCTVELRAPQTAFADRVQELHIKIIHSLIEFVEASLPQQDQ